MTLRQFLDFGIYPFGVAIKQDNEKSYARQFHDFVIVTIKREIVTFATV